MSLRGSRRVPACAGTTPIYLNHRDRHRLHFLRARLDAPPRAGAGRRADAARARRGGRAVAAGASRILVVAGRHDRRSGCDAAHRNAHGDARAATAFGGCAGQAQAQSPQDLAPRPRPTPVEAVPEPAMPDLAGAPSAATEVPKDDSTGVAVTAEAEVIPGAATGTKTLPPRVDLAYKVFYGTQGFLIGEAVYRFEHANNRYRIATIGEARGLAALVLRGQGKIESRGLITDQGLLPADVSRRTRRTRPRGNCNLRLGKPASSRCTRTRPRRSTCRRSIAVAHVAVLLHAANGDQRVVHRGHAAPRPALHDHARGDREDRMVAGQPSTPSAGTAAAMTARPTRMCGSRRRCTTSR